MYLTKDRPLENVTTSLSMAAWRPGGDTHSLSALVVFTSVLSGTCWHGKKVCMCVHARVCVYACVCVCVCNVHT